MHRNASQNSLREHHPFTTIMHPTALRRIGKRFPMLFLRHCNFRVKKPGKRCKMLRFPRFNTSGNPVFAVSKMTAIRLELLQRVNPCILHCSRNVSENGKILSFCHYDTFVKWCLHAFKSTNLERVPIFCV